jgi:hypothetical protein
MLPDNIGGIVVPSRRKSGELSASPLIAVRSPIHASACIGHSYRADQVGIHGVQLSISERNSELL